MKLSALEQGDPRVAGLMRVGLGAISLVATLGAAREYLALGYFGDTLHVPYFAWLSPPARIVFASLLTLRVLSSVLVLLGMRARPALLFLGLSGLYILLLDRLQFHHNRYALALLSLLLAFSECTARFSLIHPRRDRPIDVWALRLIGAQLSLIYLASGMSKLLDPDWRGGVVLAQRILAFGHRAVQMHVPASLVDALASPRGSSLLAKATIATELFLALGLWSRRTRPIALWLALVFHLTIEVTSRVESFSWLMLVGLLCFVTHDNHARALRYDAARRSARWLAAMVRRLDWLGRFDVRAWETDEFATGRSWLITDRTGALLGGVHAAAALARAIPVLFLFWGPLAFFAGFQQRGALERRR